MPARVSGWGELDFGNQAEQEHTTAACWNNRVAEMTPPHGSYYLPRLLIGYLDCREKRLVWSTVARSHIIDESVLKGMLTEEYISL